MRKKSFKIAGKVVLALLFLFVFWMILPRTLGFLFPNRVPLGYGSDLLSILAVGSGLEPMAELEPKVPENVEEIKNIEYKNVNGKSLQLDFYKPKTTLEPLPLLVFIHGGGWKKGKREDYLVYLTSFAEKGYMTATISYRLLKDSIYPAAVEDTVDAVRWLFENAAEYGYDPDRIALIGGSAGAHLAMLGAYGWGDKNYRSLRSGEEIIKHRIKAVVEIYGPTDLTTKQAKNHPLIHEFLGHTYDRNPELYVEASPVTYVKRGLPPTLILHGTSDHLVPVIQGDILKTALEEAEVPCEYFKLPLWPHTMDKALRVNQYAQEKMDQFFQKYL